MSHWDDHGKAVNCQRYLVVCKRIRRRACPARTVELQVLSQLFGYLVLSYVHGVVLDVLGCGNPRRGRGGSTSLFRGGRHRVGRVPPGIIMFWAICLRPRRKLAPALNRGLGVFGSFARKRRVGAHWELVTKMLRGAFENTSRCMRAWGRCRLLTRQSNPRMAQALIDCVPGLGIDHQHLVDQVHWSPGAREPVRMGAAPRKRRANLQAGSPTGSQSGDG